MKVLKFAFLSFEWDPEKHTGGPVCLILHVLSDLFNLLIFDN